MTNDAIAFFGDRFGITASDVDRLLSAALETGADFADLYFEYRTSATLSFDEGIVKSTTRSVAQGVGARVVAGEKTGYAYTDEISVPAIRRACATAAVIARGGGS